LARGCSAKKTGKTLAVIGLLRFLYARMMHDNIEKNRLWSNKEGGMIIREYRAK